MDFGTSKDLKVKIIQDTLNGKTTPMYAAPEVIDLLPSSTKVDMWSLGIILYQLVYSLKHPFIKSPP